MASEVLVSDEFRDWYEDLSSGAQKSVRHVVNLLEEAGVLLPFPYSSEVKDARRVTHLRELRTKHNGRYLRILYAFDPKSNAYLILGGDKTGQPNWYRMMVRKAEGIYLRYITETSGK